MHSLHDLCATPVLLILSCSRCKDCLSRAMFFLRLLCCQQCVGFPLACTVNQAMSPYVICCTLPLGLAALRTVLNLTEGLQAKLQIWVPVVSGLEKLHCRRRVCRLQISAVFTRRTGHWGAHSWVSCRPELLLDDCHMYSLWLVYALPHATGPSCRWLFSEPVWSNLEAGFEAVV